MKRFILAEKDKQAEAYAKALGSYQERKGVYHLISLVNSISMPLKAISLSTWNLKITGI